MGEQDHDPAEDLLSYFSKTANATLCDPAQLHEARNHAKASGVYPLTPSDVQRIREEDRCPCCFFPHNHQRQFALGSVDELKGLGLGFPFLFYLAWYLMAMLGVVLVVAAVPSLIGNLITEQEYGNEQGIAASSLGGFQAGEVHAYYPAALNLVALVLVCFLYTLATLHLRRSTKRLNQGICSPSDYTLVIKNLGTDFDPEALKKHLEKPVPIAKCYKGTFKTSLKVENCNISYDIRDYANILATLQDLTVRNNIFKHGFKAKEMPFRCLLGCCVPLSTSLLRNP